VLRELVHARQPSAFVRFATCDCGRALDGRLTVRRRDARGRRIRVQHRDVLCATARAPIPRKFRPVQGEEMREQTMLDARPRECHLPIGLRDLLYIVPARDERIDVAHRHALLQDIENDTRLFRIMLVPRRIPRFATAGARQRGDKRHLKPSPHQPICERAMIHPLRLERDANGLWLRL
jgi:hypothetical protein